LQKLVCRGSIRALGGFEELLAIHAPRAVDDDGRYRHAQTGARYA
jgi:hypothetical protein